MDRPYRNASNYNCELCSGLTVEFIFGIKKGMP